MYSALDVECAGYSIYSTNESTFKHHYMNAFTFLDKAMYLGCVSSHEMLLWPTFKRSQKDYDAQPMKYTTRERCLPINVSL